MSNWLRGRSLFHTPKAKPQPERKWRFNPFLWFLLGVKRLCIFLGAIVLFIFLVGYFFGPSVKNEKKPTLPNEMVLFLKLEEPLQESRGTQDYFSQFGLAPASMTVSDFTNALDKAASDKRVKGFVLSMRSGSFDLAQLQEIRAAVLKFKTSGKFTKVYAPSYGEAGSGLGMYYLASAFDEIWMQPVGVVSIAGLSTQTPFFKDTLNRYGIRPEFFQRKEYKNAMENMTASEMSPASREMMTSLVHDLGDQITTDISKSRKKLSGNFRSMIDRGLYTDQEALKAGLIDRLDYGDVMLSELRMKLEGKMDGEKTGFTDIADYASAGTKPTAKKNKIAVIHVQGVIQDGGGSSPYTLNEKPADSYLIAQTIRDAAIDKAIDTIVIRINSPGGSPSASETIRRAIVWAKETKKKSVIVSMGGTAASGGYWIAADADRIYADAATLTGSIGVVGGKFDASGLWDRFDVKWDGVSYGQNAGMWSMNRAFTASEQERFEASLDSIYNHFTAIVAKGRKMDVAQVEKIARGRAWTGRQAKEIGLVDEIGGLDNALDDIAEKKGLKNRHELSVVELPEPENPLQVLKDMIENKSPFGAALPAGFIDQIGVYLPYMDNRNSVYAPVSIY